MYALVISLFLLFLTSPAYGVQYFFSNEGNDQCGDGLTPSTAYKSIVKLNTLNLNPGDQVLFKGGETFVGSISLGTEDSGTLANPVTITSYGTGTAIISSGAGKGLSAYNLTGLLLANLVFFGTGSSGATDGISILQDSPFGQEGITINDVEVYNYARYGIAITGNAATSGAYRHVLIENSLIHNNGNTNVYISAQVPDSNQDVTINNVTAYNSTAGSGIALTGTTTGIIRNSEAYGNGASNVSTPGPWGFFVADSTGIVVQNNYAHNNATGLIDGGGFDFDQNVSSSLMQLNISVSNAGPGYALVQRPNTTTHTNNQVLNNSSMGDGQGILVLGRVRNAVISSNTITLSSGSSPNAAVRISNTGVTSEFVQNVSILGNTLATTGPDLVNVSTTALSGQTGLSFQNNSYTGTPFAIVWGATTYTSCVDWHTATGQETCVAPPAAPTFTSVTPALAAQGATIDVAIVGTGFQSGVVCDFGVGILTACFFNSATSLTAHLVIDATAAQGARTITITNPDSQRVATANAFTVTQGPLPAPILASVNPTSGVQGDTGDSITISGSNFINGATCDFGSGITVNSCTFVSSSELTANIDIAGGATVGTRTITVINPDGQSDTLPQGFSVTQAPAPAPTVTSATPDNGAQGATIASDVIAGTNFQNGATCDYGSGITVNSCTFNSAIQLTANISIAGGAPLGAHTVTVTNPDMQSGSAANAFTVTGATPPAPTVTSASPNSGQQGATLTAVVITGTNFQSGATCSFGTGITVNSCTFNSATSLTANLTIAGGATVGTRTITVTNPDAQVGSLPAGFTVTALVIPAPTVTSVSPASGVQGQTLSVTINGTNFQSGATCSFGSGITVNSCSFNSTLQLTANITIAGTATAGVRTVTVMNPDAQSGSKAGAFSVVAPPPPAPTVTSTSPNSGVQGTTLATVITGTNFQSGATCFFGSDITVNSCTFNSATTLTASITINIAATVGLRAVFVTNPDGQNGGASVFTVVIAPPPPAPTVTSVNPASGTQGATIASDVITGTGFSATVTCSYGAGITVNSCTRNSATQATANITISATAAPGARTVTVTNSDGQSGSLSSGFTVNVQTLPAPTVTAVNPTSGQQGASLLPIVITGTNFQSGATCSFGAGITVNSCTFNVATQMTAQITIAGGATVGTRTVTVTNPDTQSGNLPAAFTVTAFVANPPTVNSLVPNTGSMTQTLNIAIGGTDFQLGATCDFGAGIAVNSCTFNSATALTANITIAAGAAVGTRTVTVTNPDAQFGTFINAFTVTGPKFARVIWSDNSDNEDGFRLYRSDNDGPYSLVTATGQNITTYDDASIPSSVAFCYEVSAFNSAGESTKTGGAGTSCSLPVVPQPPLVAISANEGSGTIAADSSGHSFDGTWNGAWITHSTFYGSSLNFTATTNLMTLSGLTTHAAQRTYELWALRIGAGGGNFGRLFDKRTSGAEVELLYNDQATAQYKFSRCFSTTCGIWAIPQPTPNVWHHIAVSYDASSVNNRPRMWVDGLEKTVSVSTAPAGTLLTNTDPYVYGNRGALDRSWDGRLDEFRIYNRLLTTAEVIADLNTPISGSVSSGGVIMAQRFGGTGSDLGRAVAIGGADSALLAGSFQASVNFGTGLFTSAGSNDVFLAKYSSDGTPLWSKHSGSTGDDQTFGVAVDHTGLGSNGNVVFVGEFSGTVDFGTGPLTSAGGYDIFIAAYQADGTPLWTKRLGTASDESANGVAIDSGGNIVVTGYFKNIVNFGGGPLTSFLGGPDTFVAKYSSSGAYVWAKNFWTNGDDFGTGITVDASDNVIFTGYFYNTVDFRYPPSVIVFDGNELTSAGLSDIYIAKLSPSGTYIWSKRFGSTIDDFSYGVAVDSVSGEIVATGVFQNSVDFGGGNLTSAGGFDIFLVRYAATSMPGVFKWAKRLGGPLNDFGYGVTVNSTGQVIATGTFQGTVDFGGGGLVSAGNNDVFVAKYSGAAPGAYQWAKRWGSPLDDFGYGVTVDTSDRVVATGGFQGTVDFGTGGLASAGFYDVYLLTLAP